MANSKKAIREKLKMGYLDKLTAFLTESGEEVLRVKSNEIAIPVVDEEGDDDFIVITVKAPTGSRDDNLPYDGYSMAETYEMGLREKEEKKKEAEEKKKKKIEKDKKAREEKKKKKEKEEE